MSRKFTAFPAGALLLLFSTAGHAGIVNPWALCGVDGQAPTPPASEQNGDADAVHLTADSADLNESGTSILSGNVFVQKGSKKIQADKIHFHKESKTLDILEGLRYWDTDLFIGGARAHFDLENNTGLLENISYQLTDQHGRGNADAINLGDKNILLMEQSTYTTCTPGKQDWILDADSVKLDRYTDVGTAKNVTVRFRDIPIFYSPRLTFPLSDKRKTGFLSPSYGSSNTRGLEVTIPFYWNLAPNRDATIGLRAMSKRGLMLQGEYRYLLSDGSGDGELAVEHMPRDRDFDDKSRGLYTFRHDQRFGRYLSTSIDLNHTTDTDYFDDLGTKLSISSQRFLRRNAELNYHNGPWHALARVQTHQTVDTTVAKADRPYHRLPQLKLSWSHEERNNEFNYGVDAEYVHFDRNTGVTGKRLDINPSFSYPLRTTGTFLIPRLDYHYTRYSLDNQAAGADSSITRSTPSFSLDSGLFLERATQLGGRNFIQTLEPRLYYLYTPNRAQSTIPVFDTGEYTFSFAQMFRNNTFNGIDRIADANQATLALTSRWLDQTTGEEIFRASIGQIRYFRDRKVVLPGNAEGHDSSSDLIAEVAAELANDWNIRAGLQWDEDDNDTNRSTLLVRYQPDVKTVLNLGYRHVEGVIEQADLSTRWPINPRLSFVGRWNYELPESRILDTFAGVEYESCCWAMRAVVRHYLDGDRVDHSTGVYLQLELKGLGGVGRKTLDLLQEQIPGYQNTF